MGVESSENNKAAASASESDKQASNGQATDQQAADRQPDQEQPVSATRQGQRAAATEPARPVRSGRGIALLALLLAAAALALTGWQWWQQSQVATAPDWQPALQALASEQSREREALRAELQAASNDSRLDALQQQTADLQQAQQGLLQRLESLQGRADHNWQLSEAQYLLRLASRQLLLAEDVPTARRLLEEVDAILRQQADSGVFSLREQLALLRSELDALQPVDRSGIYLDLAALLEQSRHLRSQPVAAFDSENETAEEAHAERLQQSNRWERILLRLERYVRIDFQRGEEITPLLTRAELQRVQRSLQLALQQAQWAVLRGEQLVYQDALQSAAWVLDSFFAADDNQVQAMQARLQVLAGQSVSRATLDLSALEQALADYSRQRADRLQAVGVEDTP